MFLGHDHDIEIMKKMSYFIYACCIIRVKCHDVCNLPAGSIYEKKYICTVLLSVYIHTYICTHLHTQCICMYIERRWKEGEMGRRWNKRGTLIKNYCWKKYKQSSASLSYGSLCTRTVGRRLGMNLRFAPFWFVLPQV